MQDERPKVPVILEQAIAIIRDQGDHGLTMRQVAARAGISLGHLQHYFPAKNDLLKGMVTHHFEICITSLRKQIENTTEAGRRQRVSELVAFGCSYVDGELTDTCRIFREFWAIASRNAEVSTHLSNYYQSYAQALREFLLPVAVTPEAADRAVVLLLPWFEGYSITSAANHLSSEETSKLLCDLVVTVLEEARVEMSVFLKALDAR